jgi:signal transduction histidine kinase
LQSDVGSELEKIAREALTNALQHSRAENAGISLVYSNSEFVVKYSDNGVGLPTPVMTDGRREHHWGLVGMRERALAVGGKLEIWSLPDNGTEIEVRIPARRAYVVPPTPMMWLYRMVDLLRDAAGKKSLK